MPSTVRAERPRQPAAQPSSSANARDSDSSSDAESKSESESESASAPLGSPRRIDPNVVCGVVLCVLMLAHVAYYFPRVVDDLFISLRYAENLANGRGAVFNPGERVEGFSGPSWMLIQSLGIAIGFEPVTFTKVVGIGFLTATAFGTRAIARDLYGVEGWPAWIPAFACVTNPYFVAWSVLGLEAPLHIAAIVLCPVAIHRLLATPTPSRTTIVFAVLALVMLGSSRPESVLYVGANLIAPFASVRSWAAAALLVRRMKPLIASIALLAAGLVTRLSYYGELLPNTYRVKGAHSHFAWSKLGALWGQGSIAMESFVVCGGVLLLIAFAFALPTKLKLSRGQARNIAPALSVILCLYFTASVSGDWMPNIRHLLPITVLAPVGWACVIARFRAWDPIRGLIALAFLLPYAGYLASIDIRLSPIEHTTGAKWVVRKNRAAWIDTVLSYRKKEPPHVTRMDTFQMGQITQAWPVLETSDEPIESSWCAGRDIGAVGFYTGVRVFDTAGLITREVSTSEPWTKEDKVTDDLVRRMMQTRPLSGDMFDGWDVALQRNPSLLTSYRVTRSTEAHQSFIANDRSPPSRAEVLRRYDALANKLPQLYHLHTLYGESMGAAVLRRQRIVNAQTN